MADNLSPRNHEGMDEFNQNTSPGDQLLDENRGNPNGDVVDNTEGENRVDGAESDKKSNQGLRSTGGQGTSSGSNLGRYAGAPQFYGKFGGTR